MEEHEKYIVTSDARGNALKGENNYLIHLPPNIPARANKSNWIKTIPGKGWTMIFRLYGAMNSWFDKTWQPGKLEEIPK